MFGKSDAKEGVELAFDFLLLAEIHAVASESSASKKYCFAPRAYVATAYVDVHTGLRSQIDRAEIACIVHTTIALMLTYES